MQHSINQPALELVVARYNEPLNWLGNIPKTIRATVYDKSEQAFTSAGAIVLPNVGREAHTYLHHLVSRYDSLSEYTIFCQGKPFDHAYDFHHRLRTLASTPLLPIDFQWIGHIIDTDDKNGQRLFTTWSKNEDGRGLALASFHQLLFGTDGPAFYPFVLGGQFGIHRTIVQLQPRSFYEHALALSVSFPDAAHCFERTWDRVFGQVGIDPAWLNGRQTVYLKPIKQAEKRANDTQPIG